MKRIVAGVAAILLAGGGLLMAEQGWLAAKARVAKVLIDRSWAAHLADGERHRPWNWADLHPVAELEVPDLAVRRVVLSGATGATLAFGPGHVHGTAKPNRDGNCVVAGHRDSWFAFLERLQVGDAVVLRSRAGAVRYVVQRTLVTDRRDGAWVDPGGASRLTLITCYPFGGLRRSDLRYVVICEPEAGWIDAIHRSAPSLNRLSRHVGVPVAPAQAGQPPGTGALTPNRRSRAPGGPRVAPG